MTNDKVFIGRKDVDLTDGFKKSKREYEKMEDNKVSESPEEVRKTAEKLRDGYKQKYKNTEDAKLREITNVIENNLKIFKEIEDDFEGITRGLVKEYGTDKVGFVLYLVKVKHSCFHMDLETNTVAMNPKVEESMDSSTIELTASLKKTWTDLSNLMMRGFRKAEIMPIYLEEYYKDLFFYSLALLYKKNYIFLRLIIL